MQACLLNLKHVFQTSGLQRDKDFNVGHARDAAKNTPRNVLTLWKLIQEKDPVPTSAYCVIITRIIRLLSKEKDRCPIGILERETRKATKSDARTIPTKAYPGSLWAAHLKSQGPTTYQP